jgi:tetratricopeptide (TPR) repeat protein
MPDDLMLALQQHQRGFLDRAAQLYRRVLAARPGDADALHLLGVVAHQQGNRARAAECIARAIARRPGVAAYHANLGEVYRALGQLDHAVRCCRTALSLNPTYAEAANNLGTVLLEQGRFSDAADQFRSALSLKPDFALAANNLGNALRLQGNTSVALDGFRKAIQLDPDLAVAHSNLGQLLLEQHQPHEALEHCRAAVRLRPDLAEAHSNLGNVLREFGRLAEARDCYAEALRLRPNLAMLANNMGQVLQEEGRLNEALGWYQHGLQLDAHLARLHISLAGLLEEVEQYTEAGGRYEAALRLDPNDAEAHNGLGWVRHEQGRFDQAREQFLTALRLKPDCVPAHCNLGTLSEEAGDLAEAERCFREAVRHDRRHAGAWSQLATLLRGKLPEEDLSAMRRLLAEGELTEPRQALLHFGLAQVLDARESYDEAAEHLRQANALHLAGWRRRGQAYDAAAHSRFVDQLISAFTPDFFERARGWGVESDRPVFIFGLPRSGTTLIEQVLASHSQVHGAGELRQARESFAALAEGGQETRAIEGLSRLDAALVRRLAADHLAALRSLDASALRVVDKMPDNYLYLGLLAVLFPKATFIHCRRDLRDVAVSCWMTNFRHIRWASESDDIAGRFRDYERLMAHWLRVLPVQLLEVDYEETVAELEGVARRLVSWCGLEWEPACLAFHEGKRSVRTASVTQVRQPIYTRSVARWKHYEPALGELFAKLGPEGETESICHPTMSERNGERGLDSGVDVWSGETCG